jgi:hypothetical protein
VPTTSLYELTDREVERITVEFLATHPDPTGRFVSVVAGPQHPLAGVARTVERQIFEEAFGNDAAVMAAEYGPYEDRSLFFVVLDRHRRTPAGAGRVIEGTGEELKTVDDAPAHIGGDAAGIMAAHDMAGEKAWDFATVAVLPGYRGGRSALTVSSLLYRTFLVTGARAGVRHVVTMLDRRAYRNMRLLGVRLTPLAGSAPFAYLGSKENRALYVEFAAIRPAIAEQAVRLRRPFGAIDGEIRARGLRRLLIRRAAAGVSRRVATGAGLDRSIVFAA